jgi:hypothetical protein
VTSAAGPAPRRVHAEGQGDDVLPSSARGGRFGRVTIPDREPLAAPQMASGHVVMAAARSLVPIRALSPPNLVPL